ncbi:Autophagy-related protein [Mycena chlorophos]|uniref:Autophagy-related protein n=1 Tax=Mycena chlorophos TaxID=658473 RepID=A0A8H6S6L2_MYCCL|nr:Autophagy-related protein [Mycena chlorophos]
MLSSTSKSYRKRLHGWLSYAFASEVFVIVSLTLFLPICLEQFASDNGYLLPAKSQPCMVDGVRQDGQCAVKIGWLWIDTASFSLYTYSASVALQALTVISMGGIADHPPHRKKLLLTFAFFGSSAATLFLFLSSTSPVWYIASLLACVANVGFGASIVAMNSYLPSLAKDAPEVVAAREELEDAPDNSGSSDDAENPNAPLIAPTAERVALQLRYETELSRATSRISSLGIAIGYGAGICLLALTLIPVVKLKSSTFSLRLSIGLSGIWWAFFTLPAALWLPGASASDEATSKDWSFGHEIVAAWKRLGGMLHPREIAKLRNTFKYLAAWFLLSDGFTTITSTAVLFAKTTLQMPSEKLVIVGVLTPMAGIGGSLLWPFLQRRFGWSNLRVLITLVVLASAVPAYGCLGFLPIFHGRDKFSFGGLTSPEEIFILALYFGSIYGAFQSFARAFYAELLPPGEEARWYGLFSITDKSSSFIGPLIVGIIADTTGNIRYSFFFLVFMVWAAVPILLSVNVEQGRKDAREYRYRT